MGRKKRVTEMISLAKRTAIKMPSADDGSDEVLKYLFGKSIYKEFSLKKLFMRKKYNLFERGSCLQEEKRKLLFYRVRAIIEDEPREHHYLECRLNLVNTLLDRITSHKEKAKRVSVL